MKKILSLIIVSAIVFVLAGNTHATLIDNGGGLIYDTDLNITWYDSPNFGASWDAAMNWASGLTVGGVSGWRLPNADLTTPGYQGVNCTAGEMGHLYYIELGLTNGVNPENQYPFVNLLSGMYWSGTEYAPNPEFAYMFSFGVGTQGWGYAKTFPFLALAVHDGDVGGHHCVPEPSTMLLLGSGLIGLLGFRKKFRK